MELLKYQEGRQILWDKHLDSNRFLVSQRVSTELAPGYWTTPTDCQKRSLNLEEDSELPGIRRRFKWDSITCIIVSDNQPVFLEKVIQFLTNH
jgi:hypothetical protein